MTALGAEAPLLLDADDPSAVARVAAALRSGHVAAIPTDTVYGLAAALDRPHAIARLYGLKSRPREKAIPVLLADAAELEKIAADVPPGARALIERFWPGALTIVVPALPALPDEVTSVAAAGVLTVAVRVPDHRVARDVLAAAGGALAVTSANRSGDPPALDAQAVLRLGNAAPDIVLDGGPAPLRHASTVVLAIGDEIVVLREDAIPASRIAKVVQVGSESWPEAHAV